ncbi:MAG: sensor histidine kinase [Myxococcales bacterium]|nr:sensor histidine kinase [Myxococcales bacterium]
MPTPAPKQPSIESLTRRQFFGIYALIYVVYGIVALRVVLSAFESHLSHRYLLLVGVSLLTLSFVLTHLPSLLSSKRMALLLAFQSILILACSIVDESVFMTLLFFLPSIASLMLYFPGRTGIFVILLFMVGALGLRLVFFGLQRELVPLLLVFSGFFLIGSYIDMFLRAKEAFHESQDLLLEVQDSHKLLQLQAAQIEELATTRERNRLARELHDSVSQMLFSISFLAQSALLRLDQDPEKAKTPLTQLQNTSQNALKEMRALISQLRPPSEELNFLQMLRDYLDELTQQFSLRYSLDAPEEIELPPHLTFHLFRIVQEALHNVVKHTPTKHATLTIEQDHESLRLTLQDKGPGFDINTKRLDPSHYGLNTMQERAGLIDAILTIQTQAGQGTTLSLILPLQPPHPSVQES